MASEWQTFVLGAKRAISAAAALPALFSSIKLIVELIISRQTIPTKSCQSGPSPWNIIPTKREREREYQNSLQLDFNIVEERGREKKEKKGRRSMEKHYSELHAKMSLLTPPLARTIAIIAAASITHDKGFHIKLKNFKNLFSCIKIKWFFKVRNYFNVINFLHHRY